MRHTLGFRIFVDPNTQAFTKDEIKWKTTAEFSLYYALDGMFDFVKNGDNHFGMILGVGTDVISANFGGIQEFLGSWNSHHELVFILCLEDMVLIL